MSQAQADAPLPNPLAGPILPPQAPQQPARAPSPGPLLPTPSPPLIAPVFVLEERLHVTAAALADRYEAVGEQFAPELGQEDALPFGLREAGRTMNEAEALITAWSLPGKPHSGWSDAARIERWHLAGRGDLGC